MAQDRRRIVLNRLMQLAVVLSQSKRGLTIQQVMQKLEWSKSTAHRDIRSLRACGIDVKTETVTGHVRYSLGNLPLPSVVPSPLQLAALRLARDAINPFEGTSVVEQLDQLLRQWDGLPQKQLSFKYPTRVNDSSKLVGAIDQAIAKQKRVTIVYQGDRDGAHRQRKIDPIQLRAKGEQLYLFAYDTEKEAYRTFKPARMSKVLMLAEPAGDHSRVDVDARFARAIKTWTAPNPTTVVVRLAPEKARFAEEYPLIADQSVVMLPDGSAEISANVNGLTEALNWVLGWGAHAEAVSPPEFRALAAEQVRGAAEKYSSVTLALSVARATDGRRDNERETEKDGRSSQGSVRKVGKLDTPNAADNHGARRRNAASDQVVSRDLARRARRVG